MDQERYGELLAKYRPRLIDSPQEHERLLSLAESLIEKADALSDEEEQLLALISLLISAYEAATDDEDEDDSTPAEPPPAHETLKRLMQSSGVETSDIAPIFGTPYLAAEVIEGRRPVTRAQAKQLSKFFRVPEKLFRQS